MIELRSNGLIETDLTNIVGRIVMLDASNFYTAFKEPHRVLGVSGKSLEVVELDNCLDHEINRIQFLDASKNGSRSRPIQFRSVRLICDNAEEVNRIRALDEEIFDEFVALKKAVPGRYLKLSEEMASDYERSTIKP